MHTPVVTRLVIGPNASLGPGQAWAFMGCMCAVALGIAALLALQGYWPILPFAGLELAALGAALCVTQRRNRYREVLSFGADSIRVEFGWVGEGAFASLELPRAWTRLRLRTGPHRHSPTSLGLEYCGQRVEIGRCLTDEERSRLGARIRELLKPAWGSAAVRTLAAN